MKVARTVAELPHPSDKSVALVPTMGALHEGHLDLMRTARKAHGLLAVSLFVNPAQFGAGEDLARYPRDFDRDASLAESCGVDVLFAPTVEEVYPRRIFTTVHVPELSDRWEGALRPGHFDGVATVVAKLFNMVRPDTAYFGQKDLQQTVVIRRMVTDLNMPVKVEVVPTTRERDGLALSSRNAYLTREERQIAPMLFRELSRAGQLLTCAGDSDVGAEPILQMGRNALASVGFVVDYFDLVDRESLDPVSRYVHGEASREELALIAAARLGRTRLIDNLLI